MNFGGIDTRGLWKKRAITHQQSVAETPAGNTMLSSIHSVPKT